MGHEQLFNGGSTKRRKHHFKRKAGKRSVSTVIGKTWENDLFWRATANNFKACMPLRMR